MATSKRSFAARLMDKLPKVDARRRALYLAAFTPEQCEAWGRRNKATSVLAEAERFIADLARILEKPASVYSAHRFAWLCTLVAELKEACASLDDGRTVRMARQRAVDAATAARRRVYLALDAAAVGNPVLLATLRKERPEVTTPARLHGSFARLLDVAEELRSTADGAVLAADVGLSDAMLSSSRRLAATLKEATQKAYGAPLPIDGIDLDRLEGRVLREMGFAVKTLGRARALGEVLEVPKPGRALGALMRRQGKRKGPSGEAEPVAD